jgi:hypothetical protein
MADDILAVLNDVQWESVAKTFGSSHSTLLGAFVLAWNRSGKNRFTLESGCSPGAGHVGSNFCDAVFCEGDYYKPTPIGILEVEAKPFPPQGKGGKQPPTIYERMGRYWSPEKKGQFFQYFANLSFAVLVAYPYGERVDEGRLKTEGRRFLDCVKRVREDFRLFLVVVQKCSEKDSIKNSIRSNSYYSFAISNVEWCEISSTDVLAKGSFQNPLRAGQPPATR